MVRDVEPSEQQQTQGATQSQTSNLWSQVESQPMDNIVWGRLYGKNIKVKSLGTSIRPYKILYLNTSFSVGNIYVLFVRVCLYFYIQFVVVVFLGSFFIYFEFVIQNVLLCLFRRFLSLIKIIIIDKRFCENLLCTIK